MIYVDIIGFLAAVGTTSAFLPQVIKAWKTKHTKDLSLYTTILFLIGIVLWFVYGLLIVSYPIIVANAISLVLVLSLLILKIKYK